MFAVAEQPLAFHVHSLVGAVLPWLAICTSEAGRLESARERETNSSNGGIAILHQSNIARGSFAFLKGCLIVPIVLSLIPLDCG